MSRRVKFPDGGAVVSFSCSKQLEERLNGMPNRSDWIARTLEKEIGLFADDLIAAETSLLEKDNLELKARILNNEKVIQRNGAMMRSNQNKINRSHEARLRLLEATKGIKNPKAWLEGRIDVVAGCDFKSVDEALVFLTSNQVR